MVTRCATATVAVLTLQACSGAGGADVGVPSLPGQDGLVRVEIERRVSGADAASPAATAEVGVAARFLRFRGVERTTADLLAGGEPAIAEGCQPPAPPAPLEDLLAILPDTARVEHLDAGEISVQVDGATLATAPRRLPPLSPWVGGVEYDQPTVQVPVAESLVENHADVTVTGFGGQHIGAFDAQVALPPGHPTVSLEPDLVVRWPIGADEVIVTVDGAAGPVCRGADRGELRVPASLLPPSTGELTIAVERVRRLPLSAPGMVGASLEVAVRDVLPVARP